ncbi:type II toxin-antitoxin system mRNA interferase toxin, RelE/StbE family [Roseobacter sp. HKCCD9010]|nr:MULTISPECIES: type II toxin-antitoxin system RelE/ParE family toxin [unclassified Roseobacter]MBF9051884.1 type II toxin-antitoxin system mRNA interferase toxin, RelE/StbE family [Rhodobacterales bacterium HKCCD4356]NNW25460.1 type II toxin-antitoxin system mRNA interferase toxin, RelE/StbE family [Roseobacter sp. HKCCD5929]NNW76577.1 type II toxin-antitoxin system mRNA interferase toxin, RelE/StbE family [Roseobacter sp. HKCCD8710]NNX27787.1 type II toxin-antitoxin system mRNA interferase t
MWTNQAARDLEDIHSFLEPRDPQAAARIIQRLARIAKDVLEVAPDAGRPGRVEGTRELVVTRTPYIIAYEVDRDDVRIVSVIHSRRVWPEAF